MSIKTLHLTNCFHSESGGIATFYREMLKGAERLGREMRLVVPASSDSVETHGRYGKIYHVAARPSHLSPSYRLMMPRHYLFPNTPLRRILTDEKPELVECCDKYTMNYMAALLRLGWFVGHYRPAVVGLSCERMDENVAHYISARPAVAPLCQFYMKHLYFPMFDHHIAVSAHVAGELHEAARGHGVRRGVWVRPMGAECDLFHPGRRHPQKRRRLEEVWGAPEQSVLLFYAGRLVPEKNLGLLLKIVQRLERESPGKYHLLVAGDGSRRGGLEQACAEQIPGAVSFMGHVRDRETLADVYANCDIFLHPNPGEPFGIAPLEAMASGLPLIAPNTGGLDHLRPWRQCLAGQSGSGSLRTSDPQHSRRPRYGRTLAGGTRHSREIRLGRDNSRLFRTLRRIARAGTGRTRRAAARAGFLFQQETSS